MRLPLGALGMALTLAAPSFVAADDALALPAVMSLPVVNGWKVAEDRRAFGPANLYEHIDGASELYLSYGFESLLVAEFRREPGSSIVVEVFRHRSPPLAFGIYSQERPREGRYLAIGAEGYLDAPSLNFLAGSSYVKLSGDGPAADAETLRAVATAIAKAIGGEQRLPPALDLLPAEGRVPHSERFTSQDFLGYSCLHSVWSAEYRVGEAQFQAFVVESGAEGEAAATLRRYLEAADPSGAAASGAAGAGAMHRIQDRYNGEVAVGTGGRFLYGVVQLADPRLRDQVLQSIRASVGGAR